jgi:hypothetical protein
MITWIKNFISNRDLHNTHNTNTLILPLPSVIKQSTNRTTQSVIQNTNSVSSHCGPRSHCAQTTTTWSFFSTGNSMSLLPVNKYITLSTSYCSHNSLCHDQHNSLIWKHFMYDKAVSMFHLAPHSEGKVGCRDRAHIAPHILALALDTYKWLASSPSHFTLSTDWIGGWAGLRGCLDALKMTENFSPASYWWIVP